MIYGPLGGSMVEFEYDCRNRLISSAGDIAYEYDAEDNRIAKTADGIRTEFVIDTVYPLSRTLMSTTDNVTTYYIWGNGLISQENQGSWLFYHFNNIGSTQAVTTLDGEVAEKFEYSPYGNLTSGNESGILFLYNGQFGITTEENGLLHMRARYYNPEIMRFINPDPIKDGWNWYAYAAGDPISLFDPFGLFATCDSGTNWNRCGFCGQSPCRSQSSNTDAPTPNVPSSVDDDTEIQNSNKTLSISIGGWISWGFRVGAGVQFTFDRYSSIGIAPYIEFGIGTPSVGVGASFSLIDQPRIEQVEVQNMIGSTGGSIFILGAEFSQDVPTSISLGLDTIPFEWHGVYRCSPNPYIFSYR